MAVTEQQILDALGHIADPEKGSDIVSLGMISGLAIRDGNVAFAIEVDRARGPQLEPLREAAEKAIACQRRFVADTLGRLPASKLTSLDRLLIEARDLVRSRAEG